MDELSIKIKIADKEYPMRIQAQDEELLRAAGKLLNEKIRQFKTQFKIENKQDLLSMIAFDMTVSHLKLENKIQNSDKYVAESLDKLNRLIEQNKEKNNKDEDETNENEDE